MIYKYQAGNLSGYWRSNASKTTVRYRVAKRLKVKPAEVKLQKTRTVPFDMVIGADDVPPDNVTDCPICKTHTLRLNRTTCRWYCKGCNRSVPSTEREVAVPRRVWDELERLTGRTGVRLLVAPSEVQAILIESSPDLRQFLRQAHPRSKRLPVAFRLLAANGQMALSKNEDKVYKRVHRLAPEVCGLESSKRKLRKCASGGVLSRKDLGYG